MSQLSEQDNRLASALLEWERLKGTPQQPAAAEFLARYPHLPELADVLEPVLDLLGRAPQPTPPTINFTGLHDYELLGELGRGAMGVVYRAWQRGLERHVALKMIRGAALLDPEVRQRFAGEAANVARLDHPNIVPVHEFCIEDESQPFFSMKLIDGPNLAAVLKQGKELPPPRDLVRIVALVARAVHHAHQRRILHRDLKPGNILLQDDPELHKDAGAKPPVGAAPLRDLATAIPYVSDFGLARRIQPDAHLSHSGTISGTPSYMAPEQAFGLKDLTTAVDVYGLGAILYECLTGRPPFLGTDSVAVLLKVRTEEPAAPSGLKKDVDRDLETICLKCLRKEPEKRYTSAAELADDLERWQRGEPILAQPTPRWERARKWCRRRPGVAALLGCIALLTLTAVGFIAWLAWERGRALTESDRREYLNQIALTQAAIESRQLDHAEDKLNRCQPHLRRWEWNYLKRLCERERTTLGGKAGDSKFDVLAYSPDGDLLATADQKGIIAIWDIKSGRKVRSWLCRGRDTINSLCFSGDGRCLLTAGLDNLLSLWDVATGAPLQQIPRGGKTVAADRRGEYLATLTWDRNAGIRFWRLARQGGKPQLSEIPLKLSAEKHDLTSIALSPDGRYLAVGDMKELRVWEVQPDRATPCRLLPGFQYDPIYEAKKIRCLAFSATGTVLASGTTWPALWDVRTGKMLQPFQGAGDRICSSISLSADGKQLAATFGHRDVRVWDTQSGKTVLAVRRQPHIIEGAYFSPDPRAEKNLALLRGNEVTIENIARGVSQPSYTLQPSGGRRYQAVAFSPDGKRLAVRAEAHLLLWQLTEPSPVELAANKASETEARKDPRAGLTFAPTGELLVSGAGPAGLESWHGQSGTPSGPVVPTGEARSPTFDAAGRYLATSDGTTVQVRDLHHPGRAPAVVDGLVQEVNALGFAPKQGPLVIGGTNGMVCLWELGAKKVRTLGKPGHTRTVTCVAFRPDGKLMATGSGDMDIRLWELPRGRSRRALVGHTGDVTALAFSPDGSRIASASLDGTVKLWDAESGLEVLTLLGHDASVTGVAFDPTGQLLASCGEDGVVRIWDGRTLEEQP